MIFKMNHYLFVFLILWCSTESTVFHSYHGMPHHDGHPLLRQFIYIHQFTQKLDNFDPSNKVTWKNRYIYNDRFASKNGPLYVLLIGESNLDNFVGYLHGGTIYQLAKQTRGVVAILEHRFYGGSVPNGDLSTENLKYLTIEQALADIEAFITGFKIKNSISARNKVIVLGGSYAGLLAARMRQTYPKLVRGAVSSSAPLQSVVSFPQYYESVVSTLNNVNCTDSMRRAFQELKDKVNRNELLTIHQDFRLCSALNPRNSWDLSTLFQQLSVVISNQIQYGTPTTVQEFCSAFMAPSGDYNRLVNLITNYLNSQPDGCIGLYGDMVRQVQHQSSSTNVRPWLYQQCTQLGDLVSTNPITKDGFITPFLDMVSIEWWYNLCQDSFGLKDVETNLVAKVNASNSKYGGNNPDFKNFTNIVSTQGTLDPWMPLGLKTVPKTYAKTAPFIIIKGASHCADLSEGYEESLPLKLARSTIMHAIKRFLMY